MTQQPFILVVNSRVVRRPVFLIGAPHSGVGVLAGALGRCAGLYLTRGQPSVLQSIYALARRPSITHGRAAGTAAMVRDAFAEAWQLTKDTCPDCSTHPGPATDEPWHTEPPLCRHGRGIDGFGDASPDLLYSAEALAATFPDALFVQVIRDGRDAVAAMLGDNQVLSWFRPEMFAGVEFPHPFFGMESEEDRDSYPELPNAARCAMRWRSAIRLSARLRSELAQERMLTIRYEEIPGNEVDVAERLTAFVGRSVSALDLMTDGPLGIGGWRRRLDHEQYAHVRKAAGSELTRLGYT